MESSENQTQSASLMSEFERTNTLQDVLRANISLNARDIENPTQEGTAWDQMQRRPVFRRRGTKTLITEVVWFSLVNIALVIALTVDWRNHCRGFHFKQWAILEILLQTLMIIFNLFMQWRLPGTNEQLSESGLQSVASFYIISRLLNMFWVVWAITGIVWAFEGGVCSSTTPALYTVIFILAIVNVIVLGFPVVVCCCSIPVTILTVICCPGFITGKPSRKATIKTIKKVTTTKTFEEGLMDPEDATCVICLSEYEAEDQLRYLRCGHHFHDDCIMQWLVQNKSCPFCKKDIDEEEKEKTPLALEETEEVELQNNRTIVV